MMHLVTVVVENAAAAVLIVALGAAAVAPIFQDDIPVLHRRKVPDD